MPVTTTHQQTQLGIHILILILIHVNKYFGTIHCVNNTLFLMMQSIILSVWEYKEGFPQFPSKCFTTKLSNLLTNHIQASNINYIRPIDY